jgi:hypothetical protein
MFVPYFRLSLSFVFLFLFSSYVLLACLANDVSNTLGSHSHDGSNLLELFVRTTYNDDAYVSLEAKPIICELIPVYRGRGRIPHPRVFKGVYDVRMNCGIVAGLYTKDYNDVDAVDADDVSSTYAPASAASSVPTLSFSPANTIDVYKDYDKTGDLDYMDYWACVTTDFDVATQIWSSHDDGEQMSQCTFIMHVGSMQAIYVASQSIIELSLSQVDIGGFHIVPFYVWNENADTYDILQLKDLYGFDEDLKKWKYKATMQRAVYRLYHPYMGMDNSEL